MESFYFTDHLFSLKFDGMFFAGQFLSEPLNACEWLIYQIYQ